jgi:uncharacterized protein YggU (UPF0235/DUF167 family)
VPCHFNISVTAQAKRTAIGPAEQRPLRVWVPAPAREGRANDAVLRLLSEVLGVPRKFLSIVQGESAKQKRIFVACLEESELNGRLAESKRRKGHGEDI